MLQFLDVCILASYALGRYVLFVHALYRTNGLKSSPVESDAYEHDVNSAVRIHKQSVPVVVSCLLTTGI